MRRETLPQFEETEVEVLEQAEPAPVEVPEELPEPTETLSDEQYLDLFADDLELLLSKESQPSPDKKSLLRKAAEILKKEVLDIIGPLTLAGFLRAMGKKEALRQLTGIGGWAFGPAGAKAAGVAYGIGEALYKENENTKFAGQVETMTRELADPEFTDPFKVAALLAKVPEMARAARARKLPPENIADLLSVARERRTQMVAQSQAGRFKLFDQSGIISDLLNKARDSAEAYSYPLTEEAADLFKATKVESSRSLSREQVIEKILEGAIKGLLGAMLGEKLVDWANGLAVEAVEKAAGVGSDALQLIAKEGSNRYAGKIVGRGQKTTTDFVVSKLVKVLSSKHATA